MLSVLLTLLLISAVVSLETKQQNRSLSLEETEAEINKLVEQHQQQLSRREARQIGAIYDCNFWKNVSQKKERKPYLFLQQIAYTEKQERLWSL